jgi:sulfoxide reductase heme-binding subunit YedZ
VHHAGGDAAALSGWNWLIKLRRMLGLYVFFYGFLHFMTFLWFDHFFDVQEMEEGRAQAALHHGRLHGFVLLIPLAVTSTNGMIKRLGGKRWQWLHRLVYVIAPLAILHFWWMKAGKHNFTQPIIFGSVLGVLLLARLYWWVTTRRNMA